MSLQQMLLIILHIGQDDLGEGDHVDEHFKAIYRDDNVRILWGKTLEILVNVKGM